MELIKFNHLNVNNDGIIFGEVEVLIINLSTKVPCRELTEFFKINRH